MLYADTRHVTGNVKLKGVYNKTSLAWILQVVGFPLMVFQQMMKNLKDNVLIEWHVSRGRLSETSGNQSCSYAHTEYINKEIQKLSHVICLLRKLQMRVSLVIITSSLIWPFVILISSMAQSFAVNSLNAHQVLLWQQKAIRIITGVSSRNSCRELLRKQGTMTMTNIYIVLVGKDLE